ncbi:K(+)-transporting ATPase subunit F [Psychrobacter sp. CMS30]
MVRCAFLESVMEVFAGFLALGLFIYLLYVLIKPEAF